MNPTKPLDPRQTADHTSGSVADMPTDASTKERAPGQQQETVAYEGKAPASGTLPVIPGYDVLGVLGRGGMGVVYKAFHISLKRTVALKMILVGGHAGSRELARFRIEAEAVARLQHPNIVQIHEVGEAGGHPYCALEFVEGGTLAANLQGKSMPPREAAILVESLARAMQLAHSRNVVHRDLKPANILLTVDGTPKISDFGLARQMDSDSGETQAGTVMGTPSYMAPEQASGRAHEAGPAADIYALGAILYDCLTGRPPFKGKTVVETLDQVRTQEPAPPSRWHANLPLDLETICLKCLRKEPENRYASAAELADELIRFLNGEPILARPVGQIERAWRWCARKPALASMAAGLVAVVVCAFAVIVWQLNATTAALAREEHEKEQRKLAEKDRALALINALRDAAPGAVPGILADLEANRDAVLSQLSTRFAAEVDQHRRMRLALALAPRESEKVRNELANWMLQVNDPAEVLLIRSVLASHKGALLDRLWAYVDTIPKGKEHQRLRAAVALASFDPESKKWANARGPVAEQLVGENPVYLGHWIEGFRPIKSKLLAPLETIYRNTNRRESERSLATSILADYAADQPPVLADLLMDGDEKQFAVIFAKFKEHGHTGVRLLIGEVDRKLPADLPYSDGARESLAKRQANAAVALLRMNQPEKVWPLLKQSPEPRLRSYLIHRLSPLGVDSRDILKRLDEETDITVCRALLLSLGEFGESGLGPDDRIAVLPKVQQIYRTASDPGLHAAAEWLLRTWREVEWLTRVNDEWAKDERGRAKKIAGIKDLVAKNKQKAPAQWYVNKQGQTFVVIPGPVEFVMGSQPTETDRRDNEKLHTRCIDRTFALASTPVTRDQFLRFKPKFSHGEMRRYPDPSCPIGGIDWYDAAAYCNWLSHEEGIPEDQWCYEIKGRVTKLKGKYLSLAGYRLPTESEMEYATRAGALTSRYFGETEDLLPKYAWYSKNSRNRTWPVGSLKPNDFGLFDVVGSVYTWCQESSKPYPADLGAEPAEDKEDDLSVAITAPRVLRGGAFLSPAAYLRSPNRASGVPMDHDFVIGFRPARTFVP